MQTVDHPIYQHRVTEHDGVQKIVRDDALNTEFRAAVLGNRKVLFGYWRPCYFNELGSLIVHPSTKDAVITGIDDEQTRIGAGRFEGDPDALFSIWADHVAAVRTKDREDREANIRKRNAEDAAYETRFVSTGWLNGKRIAEGGLAIRLALQERAPIVHGRWNGTEIVENVARARWTEDGGLTISTDITCKRFSSPPDLDSATTIWLKLVEDARNHLAHEALIARVRESTSSGRGD